jgi:NTE family protein
VNEISFNSSLKKELRGIAMFQRLLATAKITGDAPWVDQWSDIRLHRIATPKIAELGASSKLNAEWAFLSMLRDEGQRCADRFLADHGTDLGKRSTYDVDSLLDTLLEQV